MKKQIKEYFNILLALVAFVSVVSCSSSDDEPAGAGDSAGEVAELKITPEEGALYVTWEAPQELVSYYQVTCTDQTDQKSFSQIVKTTSLRIARLYTHAYEIKVECVFLNLNVSAGVSQTATPLEIKTKPSELRDVKFIAVDGSANAEWIPSTDVNYTFATVLVSSSAAYADTVCFAKAASGNRASVSGLTVGTTYHYLVQAFDHVGNHSAGVKGTFSPQASSPLPNGGNWSIFDFSSEQSNCPARSVIDGAFYKPSEWYAEENIPLPHYVTIDVKKPTKITMVKIYRNEGFEGGKLNTIQLLGSLETPTDETNWIDLGTFDITKEAWPGNPVDPAIGDECYLKTIAKIRYVRVVILATTSGLATFNEVEMRHLAGE